MVQRVGSSMRLISSCVQRKRMGLLAAPGCTGPPRWCQSHSRCPLAPTALQMKTVNSAGVCCLLFSVTSNKAPPGSQHPWADRYVRQAHTLTATFCFSCGDPRNTLEERQCCWSLPLSTEPAHPPADKTHTWSHSTHRASFPTPDYSVPAVIFPGKELK